MMIQQNGKKTRVAFVGLSLALAFVFQLSFEIHRAAKHDTTQQISRWGNGLTFCENIGAGKPIVRLAAIGDTKSCDQNQAAIGTLLHHINQRAGLNGIILLGDNICVRGEPKESLKKSIAIPYASLIESGVPFYATLGNHDLRKGMMECHTNYPYLNMNGKRYYSKVFGDNVVEVFFLDSNIIKKDTTQVAWLKQSLKQTAAHWKVVAMHHPPHSTAKYHPSDKSLIQLLEPIFIEQGVNLVLSGHNHVYERLRPIHGIQYITAGSGGELRKGGLVPNSRQRAAGNDRENVALILQFTPDTCHFIAYASNETIVDEGEIVQSSTRKAAGISS